MVGPVSVVHVVVPFAVLVSALMAAPPVAAVTVTAARAFWIPRKKIAKVITPKISRGLYASCSEK